MVEIIMYPYKITITDPELIKAFEQVSTYRVTRTNSNVCKRIGHKIPRKIKRDGVFVDNGRFGIENPRIKLDFMPSKRFKRGKDFVFKSVF